MGFAVRLSARYSPGNMSITNRQNQKQPGHGSRARSAADYCPANCGLSTALHIRRERAPTELEAAADALSDMDCACPSTAPSRRREASRIRSGTTAAAAVCPWQVPVSGGNYACLSTAPGRRRERTTRCLLATRCLGYCCLCPIGRGLRLPVYRLQLEAGSGIRSDRSCCWRPVGSGPRLSVYCVCVCVCICARVSVCVCACVCMCVHEVQERRPRAIGMAPLRSPRIEAAACALSAVDYACSSTATSRRREVSRTWTWTRMDATTCAWARSGAGSNGDRPSLPANSRPPPPRPSLRVEAETHQGQRLQVFVQCTPGDLG